VHEHGSTILGLIEFKGWVLGFLGEIFLSVQQFCSALAIGKLRDIIAARYVISGIGAKWFEKNFT